VKAGTLIDAEHPGDAAHHAADDTADHGAHRTGRAFAVAGALLNAPGDPSRDLLGSRRNRKRDGGDEGGNSDKTTDHDSSNHVG
jgi:hypothetical protein